MDRHLRPTHEFEVLRRREALSRRDFLRVAASTGAVGAGVVLLGACGPDGGKGAPTSTPEPVVDPPPETTTIRLLKDSWYACLTPLYVAEQFLLAEGFTDVQYIDSGVSTRFRSTQKLATGEVDMGFYFAASLIASVERGDQLVLLAGVHNSCFELFGNDRVQSLRDLKGKGIWIEKEDASDVAYTFMAALLAYVGIDISSDVEFVEVSGVDAMAQIEAGRIDAWLAARPWSTRWRNANIGHVILEGSVDPPWSQYFCCFATANRDFAERHPAATKRALRAILKAADVCAREPERAARTLADGGFTSFHYDEVLHAIHGQSYAAWREFNPEDTARFFALRLREAGLVKSRPDELIARATDWRYLNEIKRELGV